MHPLVPVIVLLVGQATALPQGQAKASQVTVEAATLYASGLDLWKQNRLAEAQAATASAVALTPSNQAMMKSLGTLDDLVGKYDEAIVLFRALVQARPSDGNAQLDLAIALAQKGSLDEAIAIAEQTAHRHPDSLMAHRLHAKLLADVHRNDEALAEYQQAEKIAPDDALTQYDWAMLLGSMGDGPQQVIRLRRLIALQPNRAQYRFQLGQALQRSGDGDAAIAQWREAVRLKPDYREAIYNLSRTLQRIDPAEAHILELRFLQIRQSAELLNSLRDQGNKGVEAMSRQDWGTAISSFRKAMELCAGCELEGNLQKDLGLALCQSGDLGGGEEALRAALLIKPADAEIVRALDIVQTQRSAQRK